MNFNIKDRFFDYVRIDTQADPKSNTYPSTEKQKNLSKHLYQEIKALGIEEVEMDEWGLIYATLPSNIDQKVPTICFCSHMDTSPDSPGKDVKPIMHEGYQGGDIVLPDDKSQVLNPENHPDLGNKIGHDIITASGKTLLGADDKSGIAVIMALAEYLIKNPDIPHGDIRLLFTCDEEIGRGVDKVDLQKLNADFGYTLDGSYLGQIEDETFSADAATVSIKGIAEHPGYAYGKMLNAAKVAAHFIAQMPHERSPEGTKAKEGYIHPTKTTATVEKAQIDCIIRGFDMATLNAMYALLENIKKETEKAFPKAQIEIKRFEQYRNMKEVLDKHPEVTDYAIEAMKKVGLDVNRSFVRGGTDGSRLSFMGLPCPNIFTGQHGIHSRQEWISLQDMEKATATLVELVQIWANHKS